MYRIALVNMSFATVDMPSLALTQLKSLLDSKYANRCLTEICYLNQDFAQNMGVEFYQRIATSGEHHNTGVGEWFFRQVAFPELEDNSEKYFRRYYPQNNEQTQEFKRVLLEKRQGLDQFLDMLITKYQLEQMELVGFTSMFSQNLASIALAKKLKQRNPHIVIVMGGANCESPMGQEIVKNVEQVDFVFSGSALRNFPEFVGHCLNQDIKKCHMLPGVFSRTNCALRATHDAAGNSSYRFAIGPELDLDTPIELNYKPFLNTLSNNFSNDAVKPILLIETSRGCWWGERAHCTFCGLNGSTMAYRSMSPKVAIELFQAMFQYSSQCSQLNCVDNIIPKSYFKEVLPFLDTPENMSLFYEVKADLSAENIQTLSQARVTQVQPGIESLATSTLRLMRKGTNVFQNLRLLKNCVLYDVFPVWNLLIGFPDEDEEVYKKYIHDLPLLTHLPPPSGVYPVRFDRFSPYFAEAEDYDLQLSPCNFYELSYPFNKQSLQNLAYYFTDTHFAAEYFITMLQWIDKIKTKSAQWRQLWYADTTFHPELFLKDALGTSIIYDSRSGQMVEYQISDTAKLLLDELAQPKRLADLLSAKGNVHFEKDFAFLQERELLFQEGERFISLILPTKDAAVSVNHI